jgi:acetate kinase
MDVLLVLNSGSSSVKFQIFRHQGATDIERLIRGQISGIGVAPRLEALDSGGSPILDRTFAPDEIADVGAALAAVSEWLRGRHGLTPRAVGHRVVHGGPDYSAPIRIDRAALLRLEQFVALAPLHQPNNLAPIRSLLQSHPDLPQVACFDTAFHRDHGPLADRYAVPEELYSEGVRRYGFHGLSYEYIADRLPEIAPEVAAGRVIVAHLGSGASMCALHGGRSVDSTMGFTALDGIPMGTRPGQLDPGIVLYLIEQKRMSAEAVSSFLYHECGLKGLSGVSSDVRVLEASADPRAAFSLEYFAHRVGLYAGMLAAAMGGLDAFVFTAGIGENSAEMRARIAQRLTWLGASIDPVANSAHKLLISKPGSRVSLHVIPTDEEMMIARHTLALVSGGARSRA